MLCAEPLQVEADYVELFDRGRATSLHLFEHVHGDSRDRGPAMIDLGQTYARPADAGRRRAAGLPAGGAGVRFNAAAARGARVPGRNGAPLNAIFAALIQRESAYASVLGALLELAGEKVKPVAAIADDPLDQSWPEPAAFDGCSVKGQARPGNSQPIHIIRKPATQQGALS